MPVPGGALDETELRNFLSARLANYKVPKRIEIRAMLPFLPVGKIDKMSLKKELAAERG
jgi:non-ribosomal peptide synthetase component E (peptide arylation enzyme)